MDPMSATQPAHNPYLAVREDWLDLVHEPIIDAAMPIIDPHHHLWDRENWRYMPHDLLADVGSGHNIIATVFVQARAFHKADGPEEMKPIGETEFVNGAAAMGASGIYGPGRICAGIVGHANLQLGAGVTRVLEAHVRAGGDRFRGIRHIVAWDGDPVLINPANAVPAGLLGDAKFREGFARLALMDMSFEAWLYHPQLPELIDLARTFPGTKIVLNHVGGPLGIGKYAGKHKEIFPGWAASIRELATCPNVTVKLGGLGMRINGFGFETKPKPPTSDELVAAWKPYIDTCIEAFGAARCMFESNFPVDKGSYSYPIFWNACKKLAAGTSASEKADLFVGCASRFYRLGL
jgi:predicted TIM-barrel fold metal-dependent hydrolase